MELVEKPEATVDVIIRAPNRLINEISAANVVAKLNLQESSVFQREFPLNETMISVPPGASVVRVSPNQVKLKLERTKEVMLEIVPNIIGQVKEEYGITKVEVAPPRVAVRGPESKVREKDKVTTVPINVSELTKSTEFDADLILPSPDLRLTYPRNKVKVRILIEGPGSAAKPEAKKKQ
jgi:YbbR domain-containing protein